MNKTSLYICEGQMEVKLVEALLNKNYMLHSGKTQETNILEKNISKFIRRITQSHIFLIFDIDVCEKNKINQLNSNLILLAKQKHIKKVTLILQNKNLEDELVRAFLLKNKKSLYKIFNAKGEKDYKSNFLKKTNLPNILEQKKFSMEHMWSTPAGEDLKKKLHKHKKIHMFSLKK